MSLYKIVHKALLLVIFWLRLKGGRNDAMNTLVENLLASRNAPPSVLLIAPLSAKFKVFTGLL